MRYRVIGADARSKKPIEMSIEAEDEGAARADGVARGVEVERVEATTQPVVVRLEAGQVVLVELTGKRWKGLLAVSLVVLLLGVMAGGWFLVRDPRSLAHPPVGAWVGGFVAVMGFLGVVMARVGAWWGHG